MDRWDPQFARRSPLFESVSAHASDLHRYSEWPRREALQALIDARDWSTAGGAPLRLVAPAARTQPYEARVYLEGALEVREGEWHDLINVLAWLAYPQTKSALNRAHYFAWREERARAHASAAQPSRRGPVRDALTLFDESGVIVASSEPRLLDDIRAFRWKQLFWEKRGQVRRSMRFHAVGHALLEKALAPYVGMTAHALLVPVGAEVIAASMAEQTAALDACAAGIIPTLTATSMLAPLPVLGVPGWWADNETEIFYDDARYFRSGRRAREAR